MQVNQYFSGLAGLIQKLENIEINLDLVANRLLHNTDELGPEKINAAMMRVVAATIKHKELLVHSCEDTAQAYGLLRVIAAEIRKIYPESAVPDLQLWSDLFDGLYLAYRAPLKSDFSFVARKKPGSIFQLMAQAA